MTESEDALFVVYGEDYSAMAKRLMREAGTGLNLGAGTRVAIKPNLVVSRPASGGATTHPELVAGVVEHLRDCGCRDITIMESSWVGDDTRRAFAACGYDALAKRFGVRLLDLKKDSAARVDSPGGPIRVCDSVLAADVLINMPVLKGHCQTRMTCAVKNLKGCIPDSEKRRFHSEGLDRLVACLPFVVKPALTLVDGICGDLDFEEGGNPVRADRLILGRDMFLVDLLGCRLMGIRPEEVGYLVQAGKWGLGDIDADPERYVTALNKPVVPVRRADGGKVGRIAQMVDEDKACSACYANLVHALTRLPGKRPAPHSPRICIGQGWKGKIPAGIGVGDCCRLAKTHIPGCPPTAQEIIAALQCAIRNA